MDILGDPKKVIAYINMKSLKFAGEEADKRGKSKAIRMVIASRLDNAKNDYETTEGKVLMDASSRSYFLLLAALIIDEIEASIDQKVASEN